MTLEQLEMWRYSLAICILFVTVFIFTFSFFIYKINKAKNEYQDKLVAYYILTFFFAIVIYAPLDRLIGLVFAPHTTINKLLEEKK